MNKDKKFNINNDIYTLKQGDVSGFDVYGIRQKDGTILIGTGPVKTNLEDFPESIMFNGVVYNLEVIKKNKDIYHLDENHSGYYIEWGIYC